MRPDRAINEVATSVTGLPRRKARSMLEVRESVSPGRHVLALAGALDVASADQLDGLVRQICAKTSTEVVLDLSRLTFIDSSGMMAILAAGEVCEEHGHAFLLVPGPRNIQRVFQVAGLVEKLPFPPEARS
jgi:anti-anti-sigma factor